MPKTGHWIGEPWRLEVTDMDPEPVSTDPISTRWFPDGADLHPAEEYFQNPVIIQGTPNNVYELDDLVQWLRLRGTNPITGQRNVSIQAINPVRFPGFQGYNQTVEKLKALNLGGKWRGLPAPDAPEAPPVGEEARMPYVSRPLPPEIKQSSSSSGDEEDDTQQRAMPKILKEQQEAWVLPLLNEMVDGYRDSPANTSFILVQLYDRFMQLLEASGHAESELMGKRKQIEHKHRFFEKVLLNYIKNNAKAPRESRRSITVQKQGHIRLYIVNRPLIEDVIQNFLLTLVHGSHHTMRNLLKLFRLYCLAQSSLRDVYTQYDIQSAFAKSVPGINPIAGTVPQEYRIEHIEYSQVLEDTRLAQNYFAHFSSPQQFENMDAVIRDFKTYIQRKTQGQAPDRSDERLHNALMLAASEGIASRRSRQRTRLEGAVDSSAGQGLQIRADGVFVGYEDQHRERSRRAASGTVSIIERYVRQYTHPRTFDSVAEVDRDFRRFVQSLPPPSNTVQILDLETRLSTKGVLRHPPDGRVQVGLEHPGQGGTHISLFLDSLTLFVEDFVRCTHIGTQADFMRVFLQFCRRRGISIDEDTFSEQQIRNALRTAAETPRGGVRIEPDFDIYIGFDMADETSASELAPMMDAFVAEYFGRPITFTNWGRLLEAFERFCSDRGIHSVRDFYMEDDLRSAVTNTIGVTALPPEGGGMEERFRVGLDVPPTPPSP